MKGMNLKETIVVSLENYADNLQLTLPFLVPTVFMTLFIYITDISLNLSIEMLSDPEEIIATLRELSLNIRTEILLPYLSVYILLLIFGMGIDIGFIKREIEGESSLEGGIRESYGSFSTLFLLSVFYFLVIYLLFSILPEFYFFAGIFIITFLFLYTFPSIIFEKNNFIPAIFDSVHFISEYPLKSLAVYLLSLVLLFLSFITVFYDIMYFPLALMFVLPLIANFITLSYLREEKEERCPECGGILREHEGILVCTECGAEYVYE